MGHVKAASGARAARSNETREKLRDAANKLFIRQGFKETTVEEIAAAAGVTKATFYLHFARKEDLLLEYALRRVRKAREMLPQVLGRLSFREAVSEILDATVRGKQWDRRVTRLAILELGANYERLAAEAPETIFEPLIVVAQARGEVRADIPARQLSQFMMRSILGALRDWGLTEEEASRDEVLDNALKLVFDALEAGTRREARGAAST
ncbi:MAG: TetR/AcrR family transcriptional regulator [Candidatus Dadabacteria bacterium]|nr:MAG: TetR/AcrR family transcriptional regulator [Candidatus Dadabacteria bacterium]